MSFDTVRTPAPELRGKTGFHNGAQLSLVSAFRLRPSAFPRRCYTVWVYGVLSVCSDPVRSAARNFVLQAGRFRILTARSLPEAWARLETFGITAVVLDHEFAEDIGAAAFRQCYITIQLSEKTTEADLLFELSSLFGNNAALN